MPHTKTFRFPRLTLLEGVKVAFWTVFALIYQSLFGFPLGCQMAWGWLMEGQVLVGISVLAVMLVPSLAAIGMIYLTIGSKEQR